MIPQEILTGPKVERQNGAVHPMTEAEAREFLTRVEANVPKKRRGPNVRNLADHAERVGRLSPEALALYRAYATAYGA
jgi:hypothetical protein